MIVANVLFDDRYGGPQKRVVTVGRKLSESGVVTCLVLPEGMGNAQSVAEKAGIRVMRVRYGRIPSPRKPVQVAKWLLLLPRDVLNISAVLRKEKVDLVHVNGAFFVAPALAAKFCRIPLVWHLNDTIVPKKLAWMFGAMVRLLANQVAVAAIAVAKHYRLKDRQYTVLYAPVDVEEREVVKQKKQLSRGNNIRVGLIANWNPCKGIEYFVEAMAIVISKTDKPLQIVFAGSRPASHEEYSRRIEEQIDRQGIREFVSDLGFVDNVTEVIESLDVLVLSSNSEACPMVVLEAMASGVPVVATDVGGVREILDNEGGGEAGIVVSPCDAESIAEGVLGMLNSPEESEKMGEVGYVRARSVFSTQHCVEAHETLYRTLIDASTV